MTKFIMVLILVAAGLIAFNYFTTGEISLIPGGSLSEEERQVKDLADSFHAAQRMVKQAERSAAVGAIGNIAAVDDDMREIERIERELAVLMDELETDEAWARAERLEREIEKYKNGR